MYCSGQRARRGDPGKIGVNQAKEKDVNLEIARKDKERLEEKRLGSRNDKRKRCNAWRYRLGNKKIHDMKEREIDQ